MPPKSIFRFAHAVKYIRHAVLQITILLVLCATFAQSGSDLLTPEERLWLSKNQSRLTLAVETGYAPFVFIDPKGQPTGFAHEYLSLLESKLGVRFQQKSFSSLNEIMDQAKDGTIDIVNAVTKTPTRSVFLSFTEPFISVPNVIVVRKEHSKGMREKDLAGIKVSLVKSYAVTEYLTSKGVKHTPVLVDNDLAALLSVSFGHSQAAVTDLATASYLISQKGITNLRVAGEVPFHIQLSMAAQIKEPMLHSILQKGLGAITARERQEIHDRWIMKTTKNLLSDWRFWSVVGGGLTIICALIAGNIMWNRTLRNEVAKRTRELDDANGELHAQSLQLEEELAERQMAQESLQDQTAILEEEIEDRRRIEASLTQSEFFLKESQRIAHIGSYKAYFKKDCWESSETLDQIFGIDADYKRTVPGWLEIIHPDDRDMMSSHLSEEVIGKRTPFSKEYRITRQSDGEVRWVFGLGEASFDQHGTIIDLMGTIQDITERKLAADERKKLEAQLLQSQKLDMVGRLAGGIAHDFNNKLTVILGYAELSKLLECQKSPECGSNITEIIKAAEHAQEITRRLLTFSRSDTTTPLKLDLNIVLEDIQKTLGRMIGEQVALNVELQKALWTVRIDPTQLDQVITNLVVNARDAMPQGGKITISTQNVTANDKKLAMPPGDYVLVTCTDTGCGMDEKTMAQIFEPFFTTKEAGKGTGLGLSSVYGIVKQNNGYVTVQSEIGTGSTFMIYLPRLTDGSVEVDESKSQSKLVGTGTILLIEDEESVRKITKLMLEYMGYVVIAPESQDEAIKLSSNSDISIDCVLSDVVMPEMNGKELQDKIYEHRPDLPYIFMSGYTPEIINQQLQTTEGVKFVQKPINYKLLNDTIRSLIL